jgi:transketolase
MTAQLLIAAKELAKKKIDCEVVHVPTIKPLDEKTIIKSIKKTGRIVTAEEHQIAGGFGSAIAELTFATGSDLVAKKMLRIGLYDEYGQSGSSDELLHYYGLTAPQIAKAIRSFL